MSVDVTRSVYRSLLSICLGLFACTAAPAQNYAPVVPGSGQRIADVGDDFEDADWVYHMAGVKSSRDLDKRERLPGGESENGRWYEGVKRGHPDVVRRVATPKSGPVGSQGAMLLQTLHSGVPGRLSYTQQQDDFIADIHYTHGTTPVSQSPNVVVRVFFPPVDQWENRSGTHFGFRVSCVTTVRKAGFLGSRTEEETYWPGMFVNFESKSNENEHDYAYLRVRGAANGNDYKAMQMTQTGWWTFGISVTPDGRVHYFAKPGLKDLTINDHIASEFPYGHRAEQFKTFFFNVCSGDNGRSWSTPIVIDNAFMYLGRPVRTAGR